MTQVVFKGPEDIRVLGAADLKRHSEVDGFNMTRFYKNEPKDVTEEVAMALTGAPDIYGEFELVESHQDTLDIAEAKEEDEALAKSAEQTPENEGSAPAARTSGTRTSGTRSGGTTGSGTTSGSTATSSKG